MSTLRGLAGTILMALLSGLGAGPAVAAAPAGQMTWAVHITLAPTWFDPAETAGSVTPYMILYALHDAMVKPMPGAQVTPGLAESWHVSPDGLVYIPSTFEFYWQTPAPSHDPAKARQLLAEAGYPNGFDAGEFFCDMTFTGPEAVVNDLRTVGLRAKLRPIERAAFLKGFAEKKFKNLMYANSAVFGNAATRIEAFAAAGGMYTYGSYPDIDGLYREQATELDRKRREATLHRIQQLMHEKVMFAPLWEPVILVGVGPRVEESGMGLIAGYPYSAPYEDLKLKGK